MKDHLILARQRIPPDGVIMLYIPDLKEILVRSQAGCRMPRRDLEVTFLRRALPPVTITIESRFVIRQVKEKLVDQFGLGVDEFDLLYRNSDGIPEVLDDRLYVQETVISDGSRVIVIHRDEDGDQPGPLAPGMCDPWEQEVYGLVTGDELVRLREETLAADDIHLILADIVHRGDIRGMSGM
jgi:hypothetical protein